MKIDFSTPMTFYELVAIILAAVAIIIPIAQAVWKKWFITAKLSFLPTGRALLFFNQSGSYIRIDGVYESERKPISIKKIKIKVTRQRDERKLNLAWSSFISPVNQSMVGNYLQTTESAHPLRIEADSIICVFTEFGDAFDSFGKTFKANTENLFKRIVDIRNSYQNYAEAAAFYRTTSEYAHAKEVLNKEFFWEIGKYDIVSWSVYTLDGSLVSTCVNTNRTGVIDMSAQQSGVYMLRAESNFGTYITKLIKQ